MDNIEKLLKCVKCCLNDRCSDCLLINAERTCIEGFDDLVHVIVKEAHTEGAKEAWEIAQAIVIPEEDGGMDYDQIRECFGRNSAVGTLMMSYSEVKEKYDSYLERNGIVGDVVVFNEVRTKAVIVKNDGTDYFLLFDDGSSGRFSKGDFECTGEHIDLSDIFALLNKEGE